MLHFFGKLFLCLAVVICLSQIAESQAPTSYSWMTGMRDDCVRKYHSKKADIEKEFQDSKYDMTKKSMKLMQKAFKGRGNVECIDAALNAHISELTEQASAAHSCLDKIGSTIDSSFSSPDMNMMEAMRKRNMIKSGLDECKNIGKSMMKNVEKSFEMSGKRCLF